MRFEYNTTINYNNKYYYMIVAEKDLCQYYYYKNRRWKTISNLFNNYLIIICIKIENYEYSLEGDEVYYYKIIPIYPNLRKRNESAKRIQQGCYNWLYNIPDGILYKLGIKALQTELGMFKE